jgi:ATP/maltotriose-dependent transcriptional regulator MalT
MSERANIDASPSRRHIIKRPRLTRLLDETKARCILLVAPAGYGKTTLAAQWITAGRTGVWYRTDASSTDVAALATSIAQAISTVVPGAGQRLLEQVRLAIRPPVDPSVLGKMLSDDLFDWPSDAWLVIDDYQRIAKSPASEQFIDYLVGASRVRLLVTSRVRPGWATARRILYGEVYEVPRSVLAMTQEEATDVLSGLDSEVPGLLALADGWPAVIGLAAQSKSLSKLTEARLPATLYEYFAEEILRGASERLQWDLCTIAIAPRTPISFLQAFLGTRRGRFVAARGERLGFLQPDAADGMRIHPLLRHFLLAKLKQRPHDVVRTAALSVGRVFIQAGRWDDAFDVVTQFDSGDLLVELLESALDSLLTSGRLASLEEWTAYGEAHGCDAAILALAKANLSLRRGQWADASVLALKASRDPRLAARAFVLAGRVAHLMFDERQARELHRRAEKRARTSQELREAIWGQFLSACDLELDEARSILERLEAVVGDTPEGRLQLATGRLSLAARRGGVGESLNFARSVAPLLTAPQDPLTRTSFMNSFSDALVISANYAEALDVLKIVMDDIENYRLDFARPYVSLVQANAESGLKNNGVGGRLAASLLENYDKSDSHIRLNSRMIQARACLAAGDRQAAMAMLPEDRAEPITRGSAGHYTALRAFTLLLNGRREDAIREVARARRLTRSLEARALGAWTVTCAQVGANPKGGRGLTVAARLSFIEGDLNSLVIAYRLVPELIDRLYGDSRFRAPLVDLLELAGDSELAASRGVEVSPVRQSRGGPLSVREMQVGELLLKGMTNREIAKALFISDVTVKVHLRHIFAKIGARSRTQAALILRDGYGHS